MVRDPLLVSSNGLRVASLLDLGGLKAAVVQKRAEAKDYLDLGAILHSGECDLADCLAAGKFTYGKSFNPELTLKSLCYFGDGNLPTLPEHLRTQLVAAVRSVELPKLDELVSRFDS